MTRMPPPTDAREAALVALIPGLTRAARALTGSRAEAEDLVQEALLQVWTRQRAGAEITALPAYARATLRNGLRRRGRQPASEPLEETDWASATADTGERRVAFAEVMEAIAALPEDQRRVLMEVVIEGRTPEEVARRAGIPPGTVLSRLARARARLRKRCALGAGTSAQTLLPEIAGQSR